MGIGKVKPIIEKRKPRPLFLRLLMYFIIVMLIPLLLISIFYWGIGQRDVVENLKREATLYIEQDVTQFKSVIENYRHKAYLLSSNETIAEVMRNSNAMDAKSTVYQEMFSIMAGDTSLATGSVVSLNGRSRLSTHVFPQQYDLRYNTSAISPFSDFSQIAGTSSFMTLKWRYQSETNATVILNIMRKVISSSGNDLGYAVVDVFLNAFDQISDNGMFSDLVLIDRTSFYASSLMNSDRFGDLSNFRQIDLAQVGEPYSTSDGSIVVIKAIPDTNFLLAGIINTSPYLSGFSRTLYVMLIFMFIGVVVATLAAMFFSQSVARPVKSLTLAMSEAEHGKLDVQASGSRISEINQLDKSFNAMIHQISGLMNLNKEEEEKIRQAERKALEAQINPHFLYNTLNAIKSIAKLHGETEILTIVVQLGKLLRASINNMEDQSTLRDSFELVSSYLKIQQIRFSDKLQVQMNYEEETMDVKTPKLIVQPFVENAIVHGLEPKVGSWELYINAHREDDYVIITIRDNGVGFDDSIFADFEKLKDSAHNGIYNVYRRLQIHYGNSAHLTIRSIPGEGTTTVIKLPNP